MNLRLTIRITVSRSAATAIIAEHLGLELESITLGHSLEPDVVGPPSFISAPYTSEENLIADSGRGHATVEVCRAQPKRRLGVAGLLDVRVDVSGAGVADPLPNLSVDNYLQKDLGHLRSSQHGRHR